MPRTLKFSQFQNGGTMVAGDLPVGLNAIPGVNTIWNFNGGGGGGGAGVVVNVTQANHNLMPGQWVRINNLSEFVVADSTTAENAEVVGTVLITPPPTANTFSLQVVGFVPPGIPAFTGLQPGQAYFLSDVTPGAMMVNEPTINGEVSKPVCIAYDADSVYVIQSRGLVIGGEQPNAGGGGNNPNIVVVNQPGNNFALGDFLYINAANTYAQGLNTASNTAEVVGCVINPGNPTFTLQTEGFNTGAILTDDEEDAINPATTYWLSSLSPGRLTATMPTTVGQYTKPCYDALSATSGYILEQRKLPVVAAPVTNTTGITIDVNQPGHGLNSGQYVRLNNVSAVESEYVPAQANNEANSQGIGFVINVIDANNFTLQQVGFVDWTLSSAPINPLLLAANPAQTYYLSPVTPGAITAIEPAVVGQVSKLIYTAYTESTGWIEEQREKLIVAPGGGTITIGNVQTAVNRAANVNIPVSSFVPGLSITFTPATVDTQILLTISINLSQGGGNLTLYRNGAPVVAATQATNGYSMGGSAAVFGQQYSLTFLDSPATIVPVTYTIFNSAAISWIMNANGVSTITGLALDN